jgi:hypothetical protein
MTPKPVGYFFAPLLVFTSAIAFGQAAYTPEKSQSDVTWIAWGPTDPDFNGDMDRLIKGIEPYLNR